MYSDSDDDSQVSQPHLLNRAPQPQQTLDECDELADVFEADPADRPGRAPSEVAGSGDEQTAADYEPDVGEHAQLLEPPACRPWLDKRQQYPSVEVAFEERGQQTSPEERAAARPARLDMPDQRQMQQLLDRLDELSPGSPVSNRFLSRHLQNWSQTLPGRPQLPAGRTAPKRRSRFQFELDEELFYKIKKLFPTLPRERIRELLFV